MSQELNNSLLIQTQSTEWTRYHDKLFEQALVTVPEASPDRWEKIAEQVPGKSPEEMNYRYEALVHDVLAIESSLVEVPNYPDDVAASPERVWEFANQFPVSRPKKRGTPWTEEEHQRFLMGLEKYGRGDWRSISRNFVVTRSPTQVASHAQKYFLRQSCTKKERRRASIHDITTVDPNMVAPAIGQVEHFFHQNSANNETMPVSIHAITTEDPNMVAPPAFGVAEQFLHQNSANCERRPVSIHDIITVDPNVVAPAICPAEQFFRQNSANNETNPVNIHDITTVDPNVVAPPAFGLAEHFLHQNSANNARMPVSIHDITMVAPNVVPPAICPAEHFLHRNAVNNERRPASIHDITTVDPNLVPPFLHQHWLNNERRLTDINDIITVDSNTVTPATVGQNWVDPLQPQETQHWNVPYHFPDQMGGSGYTNNGFHYL